MRIFSPGLREALAYHSSAGAMILARFLVRSRMSGYFGEEEPLRLEVGDLLPCRCRRPPPRVVAAPLCPLSTAALDPDRLSPFQPARMGGHQSDLLRAVSWRVSGHRDHAGRSPPRRLVLRSSTRAPSRALPRGALGVPRCGAALARGCTLAPLRVVLHLEARAHVLRRRHRGEGLRGRSRC